MIRIAAAADLHLGTDSLSPWREALARTGDDADLLLLAGDLTRSGTLAEGAALITALREVPVPMAAVLGNHDYHADQQDRIAAMLERIGVVVLEGSATVFEVRDHRIAVAGSKGFGGGFEGACGSEFGEREMKDFIAHTRLLALRLGAALRAAAGELRIALLHYAPIPATLAGERLEIYPFLGSYLLAEAIDRAGADLVIHGHAHGGVEKGATPKGIPVRNVAEPVLGRPYTVYSFAEDAQAARGLEDGRP